MEHVSKHSWIWQFIPKAAPSPPPTRESTPDIVGASVYWKVKWINLFQVDTAKFPHTQFQLQGNN